MADQFKNFMIGLFVLAASAVIIFILMFLHPRIGDEGKLIHIRFTDIDKLTVGTRVTYAGRPVGEVVGIEEIEQNRDGKTDAEGHVYLYDLAVRVDSGVKIFNTDEVSSRTSGLLGEKSVEITPIAPKEGELLVQIDHMPVYAAETGSVEQTFKELKEVANKFDKALDAITDTLYRVRDQQIVEKVSDAVDRASVAIDKVTGTFANLESISIALNQPQQLSEIVNNIHEFTRRAHHVLTDIDEAALAVKAAAFSTRDFMDDSKLLTGKANQGQGTFGRLLNNDELYLRINSIMSKLETTLDDVNHYGLLFSSDKGWQRLRARRVNLMQQLRTPQEFRNYFNDEIDQISTSLSRVYMVLNDVGSDPYCGNLLQDSEYNKVFAELMRRVSMLEEEVRLYNIQVVEAQVHQTELGTSPACCECE